MACMQTLTILPRNDSSSCYGVTCMVLHIHEQVYKYCDKPKCVDGRGTEGREREAHNTPSYVYWTPIKSGSMESTTSLRVPSAGEKRKNPPEEQGRTQMKISVNQFELGKFLDILTRCSRHSQGRKWMQHLVETSTRFSKLKLVYWDLHFCRSYMRSHF